MREELEKYQDLYWHGTLCFSHSHLGKYFLISSDWKERAKSSIVFSFKLTRQHQSSTKPRKTDETDKDKQEEIQKLKDQLTALDTKITEAEALGSKLKKETTVPKLDIEAIKNNDLSSLEGT